MKWASAFKYLSIRYDTRVATARDLTQRVSFDNNLDGERIRLRFSNRYGKTSLRLDRVTVGVVRGDGVANTTLVTLNGETGITLQPEQEIFSDEIAFAVRAGERLAVSIFIGESQDIESVRCLWSRTNTVVSFGAGDHTDGLPFAETQPENILSLIRDSSRPRPMMFFYGFDALQVCTGDDVKVIAAFGDSITHMSCVTNALAKKLYAAYPGKVTLINSGIGGNRLLHDATYVLALGRANPIFGVAGVKRFETDVFELDTVNSVLTLIGINDIMFPIQLEGLTETTQALDLVDGYKTIVAMANAHGAKIYGATIMPCGHDSYPESWLSLFEKTRLPVNDWLRGDNDYDGVFDYDAALRDVTRPGYLRQEVHIGDGLHPNDLGGEIAAGTIDLAKLTGLE